MSGTIVKNELDLLKVKLLEIENKFQEQLDEVAQRAQKYKKADQILSDLVKSDNKLVTINVGGKSFQTRMSTLLNFRDSLLYVHMCNFILEGKEVPTEFYFDRNYLHFGTVMNYMRTKYLNLKGLDKNEKADLQEELVYYGLVDPSPLKKQVTVDLIWDASRSKGGAFTIKQDEPTEMKVQGSGCYTHYVTNIPFTGETNIQIDVEVNVTKTDYYLYLGFVSELYSLTGNCMCCNPANSFYIQCDGTTHINSVTNSNPNYNYQSKLKVFTFRLYAASKRMYIATDGQQELGPFQLTGSTFTFVGGSCNSANGDIKIISCVEIPDE